MSFTKGSGAPAAETGTEVAKAGSMTGSGCVRRMRVLTGAALNFAGSAALRVAGGGTVTDEADSLTALELAANTVAGGFTGVVAPTGLVAVTGTVLFGMASVKIGT